MAISRDFPESIAGIEIPAVIITCGCDKKELDLNHQLENGAWIHLCPSPKKTKKILLAAHYRNPFKNFIVNIKIKLQRKGLFSWLRF